jgi:hypothetical protein
MLRATIATILLFSLPLLAGEAAAAPAEKDGISKDIENLASDDFRTREAAKSRLKALPGDQAARLVMESAKAGDQGVKANLENCAKHLFDTHLVKSCEVYKLAVSNIGLVFVDLTIATFGTDGSFSHCLVIGAVGEKSAFAGSVNPGDILFGIKGPDGVMKRLPYKPADVSEAAVSLFAPLADQEVTLVLVRDGAAVDVKAKLRPLAADEMTDEQKASIADVAETLWQMFRAAHSAAATAGK